MYAMPIPKMVIVGLVVVVVVLVITAVLLVGNNTPAPPESPDSFAQCLTDNGATLYGAFWCPHCNDQKELFGEDIEFINYVECSTPDGQDQTSACQTAGIQAYPTWKFGDGSQQTGLLTFQQLAQKTGCSAP